MSSLIYLKLDGIRSYCHIGQVNQDNRKAAQQQQSLFFKKPLTLIWGHNGSGKTTIIEALRTATTGVQPPNSEKGRSFLTDSHLLGQSKTDACIELGFMSINEREIVARRHFSIVYESPNQCKFSSLRSTLQTRSQETGKLETLHSTCANFEKQIPCFLGVSVPILTNVLLCHQEEQLWMFSDNSTLKGIFDELFETTDLVNIETRLRDQLKEAESRAKLLAEKVEYSKRDIEDGQRQKLNLQQSLQSTVSEIPIISDIKIQLSSIQIKDVNFDQIQQKMSDCADIIANRNTISENKMQLKLDSIDLNQLSQQELVYSNLQDLDNDIKNQQYQLEKISINIENKKVELQELQIDSSLDTIKQEVKILRDQIKGLFSYSNNISDENLIKLVKEKISNGQKEEQIQQSQNQQILNNFSSKLQLLNDEKQQCQINIKVNEQRKTEQLRLRDQLSQEIKSKELMLQQQQQNKRLAEQQELQQQEKMKLKLQYDQVNQDLLECYDIQQKNQQISQYLETSKQLLELQEKNQEKMKKIELLIRENGWRTTLRTNGSKLERDMSLAKCEESIKSKLQAYKQQFANEQAQLQVLNEQKEELKAKLSSNKSTKYHPNELENVKQKIKDAKENRIKYIFNQTEFIDQYIQGSKQSGKCLLCQKPTDQQCLEQLKQRVQQNLPKTKAKINEFDAQICNLKNEKLKIQSVIQNNDYLEKIRHIDQQISSLQVSQRSSINSQSLIQLEKSLIDLEELRELFNNQIETQLDQLQILKNTIEQQSPFVKTNQKPINNCYSQGQLQKTKNELQSKLKSLETLGSFTDNPKQLQENISRISNEIQKLKQQLQMIQITEYDEQYILLEQIEMQIRQIEEEQKTKNDQNMETLMRSKQMINNLESILSAFEQKAYKKLELLNKSKNNHKYMEYINALQLEIKKETDKLEQIKEELIAKQNQHSQIKFLYEYILKLQKWQELDELETNLTEKIGQVQKEITTLQEEYHLQQSNKIKQDKLKTEFDLRKTKLEQSFLQSQEQKKDISKRYDGSEQKRLELLSEFIATHQIINDLKKYLSILEATMLECHGQKMKEINKYLFDTWQKIYNGQDIKFIEVKFDEIPNQKKITKKYNYRLVMRTSNNTEIDMKGRCSMGQKMLASIVFRMALAECFGSNCCFLALDEPTSNLDRKHIKTLAEQLNSLIEFMKQHNQQIQLLIITHDLDLVKMLKKHSEFYYMISKKENGFSSIEEREINELT